jgi:hypothetical protein
MPTPTKGYFVNGTKVPSVTTITGRFKESGALMYWAWDQGRQGRDFRETKQAAADAGTLAHAYIEQDIKGTHLNEEFIAGLSPQVKANAEHAFQAYLEWKSRVKFKVVESECQLTSAKHMFGGTLDAMMAGDKLVLGDWKTSSGIYQDHLIQVAGGYSLLWEENYPDKKLEGVEILRVSKPEEAGDPVSFHDHFWGRSVIDMAQRQFILLREAYDLDKRLKSIL